MPRGPLLTWLPLRYSPNKFNTHCQRIEAQYAEEHSLTPFGCIVAATEIAFEGLDILGQDVLVV